MGKISKEHFLCWDLFPWLLWVELPDYVSNASWCGKTKVAYVLPLSEDKRSIETWEKQHNSNSIFCITKCYTQKHFARSSLVNFICKLTTRLKCFVLKYMSVLNRTCGEWAPNCLHSHKCSSSTLVTIYSAKWATWDFYECKIMKLATNHQDVITCVVIYHGKLFGYFVQTVCKSLVIRIREYIVDSVIFEKILLYSWNEENKNVDSRIKNK